MGHSKTFDFLDKKDLLIAEKLLQVRDKRVEFATKYHRNTRGEPMDFTNNPFLPPIYNSLARKIVLQGSVQSKKAQPLTSKVHTPDGWKLMGELKVGDAVSTPDGGSAPILYVHPQGVVEIYRFELEGGHEVEACADHLWKVFDRDKQSEILNTAKIKLFLSSGSELYLPIVDPLTLIEFKMRKIEKITHIGAKPAQCIKIDKLNGLYITDDYVVTHNSEFIIIDHFAMAVSGMDVFFVLPKVESRTAYVQNRIDKALGMSPQYRSLVAAGSFNNTIIKNLGKGTVKYVGSNALCLALDTAILTPTGWCPLGFIKKGDEVYSFDEDGNYILDEVLKYIPQGVAPTISIFTELGVLLATPEHRIHTPKGWVPAKDLKSADIIYRTGQKGKLSEARIIHASAGPEVEVADLSMKYNPCFFANGIAVHNSDMREFPAAACVISGTQVTTPAGFKAVEDFKKGDSVISFDENLNLNINKVLALIDQGVRDTYQIRTESGALITCTDDEFFFTPHGWVDLLNILDKFKEERDELQLYTWVMVGGVEAEKITDIQYIGKEQVWDLMIQNDHTFLANGFLVHNCVIEELDECNDKNVLYAIDRTKGGIYQFERYVGNPSRLGLGINGKFMESNQNIWFTQCPGCKSYTSLDWFNSILELKIDSEETPLITI